MFSIEELGQIKVKKLATLLEKGSRQINLRLQDFVDNTNKDLALYKTRVDNMYNHLMRTFLVGLEKRLYGCEVVSKASLEVIYVKFFELEKLKDPSFNMEFNEYTRRTNEQVQAHINKIMEEEEAKTKKENKDEA